jgi:hypothetical protein
MTNHRLLIAFVAGLAVFQVAAKEPPGAVRLQYRATPKPLAYEITTTNRYERDGGSTGRREDSSRILAAAVQSTAADAKGLTVSIEQTARVLEINGELARVDDEPERFSYAMDARGQSASRPADDPAVALQPVFPAGDVPVGHRWSVTVPPSKEFALPIQVEHRLVRVSAAGGRREATILTTARAAGPDAATGIVARLECGGTMQFAVDEGCVVRSRSRIELALEFPKEGPAGEKKLTRTVERTVELRAAR